MGVIDGFRLDGMVAIISGAGKGIGASTAVAFAEAGANVAILARTASDLDDVAGMVSDRGRRALPLPTDVMDFEAVAAAVENTVDEFGGVDIVVNNAGGSVPTPFLDLKAKDLVDAFRFNVATAFELTRLALPHLLARGRGSVVNIGSMAGIHAARGMSNYGTAKAALGHLTKTMAADLAPRVRVNAVLPGAIETWALSWWLDNLAGEGIREAMHRNTLMRRNGTPEDIAGAVLFLASPAAAFITGKLLEVDGGYSFELVPRESPDL